MFNNTNEITYFAETDHRNKKIRFGIKASDRTRHVYVIGKSGMGKSTLLENMAVQDIQNGNGMAFIDPHGGTAEKLLEYIPEERMKDVIYFAPFDMEYPIAFNVMEDVGYDKRHLVVSGLMSAFEKIWADAWSARMSYILQNTLFALLEYPGSTILDINRMLADKDFRKKVVDNITDSTVKSYWVDEFAKYSEQYARDATPAIQNKVGQFASSPLIRNIIGQANSSFDIRKVMDDKKILIMNLSKGRIGDTNTRLLGSMLITKLYLAAMSRADLTHHEMSLKPNFYFYVDEFQSFANKSFADILSEARKYKLNLTIAHQYVEQMEDEVRSAVFGNVGTMIVFRVGSYDAEIFEREFAPEFTAEDFVNLDYTQIYLKLMIDGIGSKPFSATTLPPIPIPETSNMDKVIEMSRKQFATPRSVVEKFITERQTVLVSAKKEEKKEKKMTPLEKRLDDIRKGKAKSVPARKQEQKNVSVEIKTHRNQNQKANQTHQPFKKALLNQQIQQGTEQEKPERQSPKVMSFNTLKNKKEKDSENKSALKDALADILAEQKNTDINTQTNTNDTNKIKSTEAKPDNKIKKISIPPKATTSSQSAQQQKPQAQQHVSTQAKPEQSIKEIPEEILRKVLE